MLDKSWTRLASCLHCKKKKSQLCNFRWNLKKILVIILAKKPKIRLTPFSFGAVRKHKDIRKTTVLFVQI